MKEWKQLKSAIATFKAHLIELTLQNIEQNRPALFVERLQSFCQQLTERVCSDYAFFAELNATIKLRHFNSDNLSGIKELTNTIRACFTQYNVNLLQITLKNFTSKVYLDISSVLSSEAQDFNTMVFYIAKTEAPQEVQKLAVKPIDINDVRSMMNVLEDRLKYLTTKKLDSMRYRLQSMVESHYNESLERLNNLVSRVIAKIVYFQKVEEQDPTLQEIAHQAIDSFFSQSYPELLRDVERNILPLTNESQLEDAVKVLGTQFTQDLESQKESALNKLPLEGYFLKQSTQTIYERLPPTCLKLIKDCHAPYPINVLPLDSYTDQLDANNHYIVQFNHTYFVRFNSLSSEQECDTEDRKEIEQVTILHTMKKRGRGGT